jgi:hypothetical protein
VGTIYRQAAPGARRRFEATPLGTKASPGDLFSVPRPPVVKMICGKLLDRKDVDARLRKIITDAGPRIQETIKDLQIGETRFLGVLDEEPNVCYFAVLQKIQAGQGDQITTINLTANTVIKGKLLTYTVFAPYVDETTLSNLLKKQKENVRELTAANYH